MGERSHIIAHITAAAAAWFFFGFCDSKPQVS
jgi:hypothetical protein